MRRRAVDASGSLVCQFTSAVANSQEQSRRDDGGTPLFEQATVSMEWKAWQNLDGEATPV